MRIVRASGWKTYFSRRMWLLLGLLALLPAMAFLQYRWIDQVSEAAAQRAKARLENSLEQLITEFDGEITRAHMIFWQIPSDQETPAARFAERYQDWNRLAPYPHLIRDIHLIDTSEEPWQLSRVDSTGQIAPLSAWPADFEAVKPRISGNGRPGPPQGFRRLAGADDLLIDGNPAFLVPLREPRPEQEAGRRRRQRQFGRPVGWAVITFDREFIRREFFPSLAKRLFPQGSESEYELLIVNAADPESIVYQSEPAANPRAFDKPDATANLFAMRPGCFTTEGTAGGRGFGPGEFPRGRGRDILTLKPAGCGTAARALGSTDGAWKLLVERRSGPLTTAVANFRLRTMVISFGVLLVLALGITMLTISTERARALAKLQMEFAMGISHELRTPLTVIRVAADNLANGMTENTGQSRKYGRLIGDEARRLTDMVEQILSFARTQSPAALDPEPARPEQIVGRALAACGPALREVGMTVERSIEPGLPEIRVDANQIVDCVQNLLNNAVKYAAAGAWVRIRAESVSQPDGVYVRIAVEDRGPGVSPEDLPHIFEPFQRGESVRNSQIPGVGLGLSLVRRIVEAHRGSVHAENSPEGGAIFYIDLPAESEQARPAAEIEEAAS